MNQMPQQQTPPVQQSRRALRRRTVKRWPGLIAAVVTVLVGAIAVTAALLVPHAAVGEVQLGTPTFGLRVAGAAPVDQPATAAPTGQQVRDPEAGVTYALPAGWAPLTGKDFISTITSGAQREGAIVVVGVVDESMGRAASGASGLEQVAEQLASRFGEFFVPKPGIRRDKVSEPATVAGRTAWKAAYQVVPNASTDDRADVSVTVVADGERRIYALTIVQPADRGLLAEADATVSGIRFE